MRHGRPMIRFLTPVPALGRARPLIPDDAADPLVFRFELGEGFDPMRVVFGRGGSGAIDRVHLEAMPLTLPKQPAATNPRKWISSVIGSAAVTALWRGARRDGRDGR